MDTDETKENKFHLQGPGGSRYCYTRKMSWSFVCGIISKCPPRRWCLLFSMLLSSWKIIVEKEEMVEDSSLVSHCLSFFFVFLLLFVAISISASINNCSLRI